MIYIEGDEMNKLFLSGALTLLIGLNGLLVNAGPVKKSVEATDKGVKTGIGGTKKGIREGIGGTKKGFKEAIGGTKKGLRTTGQAIKKVF